MILLGPEIFGAQDKGGISKGFAQLFSQAIKSKFDWHLWTATDNNIHLRELLRMEDARRNIHGQLQAADYAPHDPEINSRSQETFAAFCRRISPKIVHHTYYTAFSNIPLGIKKIQTLHDLCDEEFKGAFDIRQKIRSKVKLRSLERADAIICVSAATKSALEDMRPDLAAKATVIHHGIYKPVHHSLPSPSDQPYFLFVGKRGGYKNFKTVAQAFGRSETLKSHALVCFGGEAPSNDDMMLLQENSLVGRVRFEGGGDDRLTAHYQNAVALVYPSRYEGFGLPLLEAMASNCPVLSSNMTSLPEVGGTAAVYVAPYDIDAWLFALENIAVDLSLRRQLILAGTERIEQFSWQTAVECHNRLYCDVSAG
nr:glycosyltransferase family 1 protein [uncultured Sphingorhabdus sp.]